MRVSRCLLPPMNTQLHGSHQGVVDLSDRNKYLIEAGVGIAWRGRTSGATEGGNEEDHDLILTLWVSPFRSSANAVYKLKTDKNSLRNSARVDNRESLHCQLKLIKSDHRNRLNTHNCSFDGYQSGYKNATTFEPSNSSKALMHARIKYSKDGDDDGEGWIAIENKTEIRSMVDGVIDRYTR
ncbi:hypothetical protein EVAR_41890_1 [Eumeta japonica]|uniref:Uncharacterized protein n=1 Tax=Eumeta variegata TaxID=151549 RepID=A0A4C1YNY7_EUMVA|nr:hypothetical protein EVAR_41890_1 [Eumeta japonica]